MSENEPRSHSPELDPQLRFAKGWQEILEASDAVDYQMWLSDLTDLSLGRMSEEGSTQTQSKEAVLALWLRALEQVADVVIDPEEMGEMSQAEIIETALITLQANLESIGWDEEGLVFTVPNMFTGEEATIDLRELPNIN